MIILSLIFWLVGLALLGGGLWLVTLDGSWYYALSGIVLIAVGAMARSRRPKAQLLYALFLVATAAWALWESGYDWWPLAPRLGIFLLLAIPLLWPAKGGSRLGTAVLLPVWAIIGVGLLASMTVDQHRIDGELNREVVNQNPDLGDSPEESWHAYGRSNMGQRFSPLEQITPENVNELELAWQYQTGDEKGPDDVGETTYEVTPLKIDDSLFLCTPHNLLIALDADTGEEQWVYDAKPPAESSRQHQTCRGVSYLPPADGDADSLDVQIAGAPAEDQAAIQCDAQLFMPTSDARLLAVDPATGARCANFADNGELDLMHNMPYKQSGFYYSTSPPWWPMARSWSPVRSTTTTPSTPRPA